MEEQKATFMGLYLLMARIDYIVRNPDLFLNVNLCYQKPEIKRPERDFPEDVDMRGKVWVVFKDNRGMFSDESEADLLSYLRRV